MNILVLNASYGGNKGAEAMITTLVINVSQRIPDAVFYVDALPQFSDYFFQIRQKLKDEGIIIRPVSINPKKVLKNIFLGLRDENNNRIKINAIIDISGLSFSDNGLWNSLRSVMKTLSTPWKAPRFCFTQDFGPADNISTRLFAKLNLLFIDKVFPRSDYSYKVVSKLVNKKKITEVFPDSALILPVKKSYYTLKDAVIVVPNEHSHNKYKEKYIEILDNLIKVIMGKGLQVCILQHSFVGTGDSQINKLLKTRNPEVLLIEENIDSRELKHIVSQAKIVIASRYHALIAALSTNTPCIALGWNPKYEELFKLYDLPHGDSIEATIDQTIKVLTIGDQIRTGLIDKNKMIKARVGKSFKLLISEIMRHYPTKCVSHIWAC